MSSLKTVSIREQNANTLQGVYFDTAVYSTAGAGALTIKYGRDVVDFGMYVILGTQTSSNHVVVLDQSNAPHGAEVVIKRQNATPSTAVVTVVTGSGAGATVGTIGSSANGVVIASFDGVANVWR